MAIPFFIIVIEALGETYRAYTPNLSGIAATGSREFVEQSVIEQISKYVDELSARHAARGLQITTALIDEKVFCLFRYTDKWRSGKNCEGIAAKEGLCRQHWRMLYGHAIDSSGRFEICYLCDEANKSKLSQWGDPCPFKASHEDWAAVLDQKRKATNAERKARRPYDEPRRTTNLEPGQCLARPSQKEDGEPCDKQALRDDRCAMHWRRAFGHELRSGRCRKCDEADLDILTNWTSPCPMKPKPQGIMS